MNDTSASASVTSHAGADLPSAELPVPAGGKASPDPSPSDRVADLSVSSPAGLTPGELERDRSTEDGSGEQAPTPGDGAIVTSTASDPGAGAPCLHTRHIVDTTLPSGEISFACSECGTPLVLEGRP